MKRTVIITAGGTGKRMGATLPKQFLLLGGEPVLFHTLRRFHTFDADAQIILSLPEDWIPYWKDLGCPVAHEVVSGGKERFHSIQNALRSATGDLIAVHDGVRPFPSIQTIQACFDAAEKYGSGVPVTEVKESLREISGDTSKALIRSQYRLVQTPQIFQSEILHKAYDQEFHSGITDDASLAEALGISIKLVPGNDENIKITTASDLLYAEAMLRNGKFTA